MRVRFSRIEVSVMLGARLMYSGVPFTRIAKPTLDIRRQEQLDTVWERILEKRDSQGSPQESDAILECELNHEELELYIQVLKLCLEECAGDKVELELQLGTRNEAEISILVDKLETIRAKT
jgi:hypothetical protein